MAGPDTLSLAGFRAWRYAPRIPLGAVLAPPYDVVERDEALALAHRDEHNVVRLVLPVGPDPAAAAARTLSTWIAEGVVVPDELDALYVYEQSEGTRVLQRGVIGALGLGDPEGGAVLAHEDVMPGPVEDRTRLMAATGANLEPIWLLFHGDDATTTRTVDEVATTQPLAQAVTPDGLRHRLWALTDPETLARVARDLAGRQALVADGHHRLAAYRRLRAGRPGGPWERGLALLVDLQAYPPRLAAIHRHVDGVVPARASAPQGVRLEDAGAEWWDRLPRLSAGEMLLVGPGGEARVARVDDRAAVDRTVRAALAPDERPPQWRALDTVVLHHVVLPAWGVPDEAVTYHHDAEHAVRRAAEAGGTAVLLAPVDIGTVFDLAGRGVRMPRKSTSFWPKPRSGLLLRVLEPPVTSAG
ncbi:MAG TPA: DUF1015 domain-containing protein [Actinomycetes bacterium]|nr:DUF1015 domain-containing protein [Actinomycetes bacterium]